MLSLLFLAMGAQAAQDKVLVIHSYHPELSWTKQEIEGIVQGFNESQRDVQVFHEYLDSKRYPAVEYRGGFFTYLSQKYQNTQINLVMVGDDPGLNIVLEYRDRFLPKVPIIYFGVNHASDTVLDQTGMTGVFETHSALETILEAVRQTKSEGIILISDSSST